MLLVSSMADDNDVNIDNHVNGIFLLTIIDSRRKRVHASLHRFILSVESPPTTSQ